MTFVRWMAALLALSLLMGCASAQEMEPAPAASAAPVYAPADITQEEIGSFVEMLFAAAIGTTAKQEKELRKEMTDEEIQSRNADRADYRARTLPWLVAAFQPENTEEEGAVLPEASPQPEVTVQPDLLEDAPEEELPVYTVEDSYAAFAENQHGGEYLALVEGMGGENMEMCLNITREICGMWMAQVDHVRLSEMNSDYRCWIYSPGTQIDYPVVQSENNSDYLKRLFNGNRNSGGTLFIDYRNLPDFRDPNTLIYGHHMRNDSMFGTLTDYAQQTYFEEHPILLVMTEKQTFLLEVFAGYTTSDGDHCYDIAISDEEDMADFQAEALRKSDFTSGVQVETTDQLVTLSTCAYAFKNARYILIGRIVPIWKEEVVFEELEMLDEIGLN